MDSNPSFFAKRLGIIVCADDFGVSSDVNNAIIRLLEHERISAVSCLVTGKAWEKGAMALKNFRDLADIGLHLFYEETPFNEILTLAYTKRLSKPLILKKFKCQLDNFMGSMGMPPDYIDGHQHIHQLPVFRLALMDLIDAAGFNRIYIRNSASNFNDILKRKISILKNIFIALPGFSLKKDLYKREIPTNNDFLGVYNFNTNHHAGHIFDQFLRTVRKTNSIYVCHPCCGNKLLNDKSNVFDIKRVEEFKYLESDQYKETLERRGLFLTRFKHTSIKGPSGASVNGKRYTS